MIASALLMMCITYSCEDSSKTLPLEVKKQSNLEKADWLLGRWEDASEEGRLSETWVRDGENAYKAETYLVFGTDTVFREYSQLKKSGKTLHCAITIPDQNNGKSVVFKLTKQEADLLVFENPKHDFPQVISYHHKGDSVVAEISGMQKGKFVKERFGMIQVK